MATFQELLAKIKNAIYGKEVRQSIHDAIEQCYADAVPGYYKPSVSDDGITLSWIPSRGDLPAVPDTHINHNGKTAQIVDRTVTELTEYDLEGITAVGANAFRHCTLLEKITLPNTVTRISANAFEGSGIKSIVFPDKVTLIGHYTCQDCTALESVILPSKLTGIWSSVFKGCTSLKKLTLNKGLKEIGSYGFQNCTSLESVILPSTMTKLAVECFKGCTSLKRMYVLANTPPTIVNNNALSDNAADLEIVVPTGCSETYKNATNWSSYDSRIRELDIPTLESGGGVVSVGNWADIWEEFLLSGFDSIYTVYTINGKEYGSSGDSAVGSSIKLWEELGDRKHGDTYNITAKYTFSRDDGEKMTSAASDGITIQYNNINGVESWIETDLTWAFDGNVGDMGEWIEITSADKSNYSCSGICPHCGQRHYSNRDYYSIVCPVNGGFIMFTDSGITEV